MKIMVNGELIDATPEQEAEILAFQESVKFDINYYKSKLQHFIDAKVCEKDYLNGVSCASYINSTNMQWSLEAAAFIEWRDKCFEYCYAFLSHVENGDIIITSIDSFLDGLPKLVWPDFTNR